MFKFPPPATNYFEHTNAGLTGHTKLVQSLRGFACRFTILLFAYRQHELVASTMADRRAAMSADEYGMYWFLEHTLSQSIALNIRALCDHSAYSLGAKSIADGLNDPAARAGLCDYLDRYGEGRHMKDSVERKRYLDYTAKYMELLASTAKADGTSDDLVVKVSIVRRWASKAIAHLTLDDYQVDSVDLHHVFLAIAILATAIECVMGDAACQSDLNSCEQQATRAGAALFDPPPASPSRYIETIRFALPDWVRSGEEFPFVNVG